MEIKVLIYKNKIKEWKKEITKENYYFIKFILEEELDNFKKRLKRNIELLNHDKIEIRNFKKEKNNIKISQKSIKETLKSIKNQKNNIIQTFK